MSILARKLFWTAVLVAGYAVVATSADFVVNCILLGTPSAFTPVETAFLTVLIGTPTTYFLISQRLDLQRAIAERERADAVLRQNEQKLRGLFNLAPIGIALTDMNGRYVEFNEAFRDICGYDAEALNTLDYWALTPPEYQDSEAAQLEALKTTGRYGPYEKEYIRKDGSRVPLRLNGLLIDGPDNEPFIWSIVEDISAQRHSEAVLIEARNAAEAAAVAKSEFLSNMSHEIRTPLTGVVGFAHLLSDMQDLPDSARRYADRIGSSAEALLSVVNDILDFSKLEAGQMELDPQPFDPTALLGDAADLVGDRAAAKGLAVAIETDIAPAMRLVADGSRIRQVLLNLMTNAVKFTDAGAVTVSATYTEDRLRVSVRDTGVGIPAALLGRLFQRFSQVDGSSTRSHGGTGLGLAISKAIVEAMGGQIGVESRQGQGSSFWFEVPAPVSDQADAEATALDAPVRLGDHRALRILVVDDVAVNRELVATILSPFDLSLTEASSGAEAVRAAIDQPFDLILMDMQMPGMDGLAATRAIRANAEHNRATPILALSANVLPAQVAAAIAAGMNDHVAKPLRPGELLAKIAQWTEASTASDVAIAS